MKTLLMSGFVLGSLVVFGMGSALACNCGDKCAKKHEASCAKKVGAKTGAAFDECVKTEHASCGSKDGGCKDSKGGGSCSEEKAAPKK